MSQFYEYAGHYVPAVCRRGHVEREHFFTDQEPINQKCETCGAAVLTECPKCRAPLRGSRIASYLPSLEPFQPPDFCFHCGQPLPWASRAAVAYHIENQLEEEPDLSDGDRRALREQLEALKEVPASADVSVRQIRALEALRKLAPKAWEAALPAVQAILTAEAKRQLGLPLI